MHEKIDKLFNSHLRYIRHSHNEVNRYFAHGEHANSSVLDLIEDLINEKAHPQDSQFTCVHIQVTKGSLSYLSSPCFSKHVLQSGVGIVH